MKFTMYLLIACLLVPLQAVAGAQGGHTQAGHIDGIVYCDRDGDGHCDCDEEGQGIKDMHIQLFTQHCGGTPLQTIHTDKEGNFSFYVPEPGHYYVKVDLDYVCGGRVPTTAACQQVDLKAGETVTLEPFGYSSYGK